MTAGPARHVLRLGERGYPAQLAEAPWPPETLYVLGRIEALDPGLAVIGARRATPTGIGTTQLFAGWAAAAGYTIISGGAMGCDQAAHRAALAHAGTTVAVLAGGPDIPYPRSSGRLLHEIASSGAVVSEHEWGTEPRKWAFRTRNRIIAGLGAALLVVEADVPSGTFSTADYALAASRDVWAVPGSIHAPESRGPNRLIRMGAAAITEVSELALELESALGRPMRDGCTPPPSGVEPTSDAVLAAIRANPQRPDDIARGLGLDIVTAARRVSALEAAGTIVRFRDGRYGPCVVVQRDTIRANPPEGDS